MKKDKKLVLKDKHGSRVLVECISAYYLSNSSLKVHLRSGAAINMSWSTNGDAIAATVVLDEYFDVRTGRD